MDNEQKLLGLLGMAMRAGRIQSGEFAVEKLIHSGKASCVIIARDASANTKSKFRNKCEFYGIPFAEFSTKEKLGHALGKEIRSSIAVDDPGFAGAFLKKYRTIQTQKDGGTVSEK